MTSTKNKIVYIWLILTINSIITIRCVLNATSTRYKYYPKYCSTPDEMSNRNIPPLGNCNTSKCQLIQVVTLIRHGSRAPNEIEPCWKGYQDSDTSSWDCNLSTRTSAPIIRNSQDLLRKNKNNRSSLLLFEKSYDEGEDPYEHLKLNGTCRKGDLLDEAFTQEFKNGEMLNDAYVTTTSDQMMLFHGIDPNDIYSEPWTYFRTDDIPRTIMSGQILLQGLFQDQLLSNGGKINIHTASHKSDILEPADKHCPRLKVLRDQAESSVEYRLGIHSNEAKSLKQIYKNKLGGRASDLMDCLMTTICSDRTLPKLLDNFDGDEDGESTFTRFTNFETWKINYVLDYNDAAYAKIASGPLWADIMEKMTKTLMLSSFESLKKSNINRFILYSAHDSTISTLLAALGKDIATGHLAWPPYASMLNFEIYAQSDDEYSINITNLSFRIVYNGDIITHYVNGCLGTEELCDFQVLLNVVHSFTGEKEELCANDGYTS